MAYSFTLQHLQIKKYVNHYYGCSRSNILPLIKLTGTQFSLHKLAFISKTLGRTYIFLFAHFDCYASAQIVRWVSDRLETHHHPQEFSGIFNKQKLNIIYINIYINSIVVLTVVLTPQSITTTTINSTLSSYSLFLFHLLQYNSHHFLSIFLIFKIIKTSFYPLIY